jgi:membrane-bound serine protease (ClpP class)
VIAFVLFIIDIKTPTHGAMTATGVICMIVGGLVLFNTVSTPYSRPVSVPLVIITGIIMGSIFFVVIGIAIRAQKRPLRIGKVSLVGRIGLAQSPIDPRGSVQIGSELWTAELAEGERTIDQGTPVIVTEMKGFHVKVKKLSDSASFS